MKEGGERNHHNLTRERRKIERFRSKINFYGPFNNHRRHLLPHELTKVRLLRTRPQAEQECQFLLQEWCCKDRLQQITLMIGALRFTNSVLFS